ncbi:MAG: lactate dehydrogenase, partial [Oscillospiraceae bacterium]|nr:lactate dehydrogenase [Oscillospiraceae bacterium]
IGRRYIELLKGFGCEICACDYLSREIEGVTQLPLDELLGKCDLFSLHVPLKENTKHIIDKRALALMPEGSVIINTSRGGLIDSEALINALIEGKIAACGLDVIEEEFDLYYYNRKSDVIDNRCLSILRDMPNVIISPHIAFYTSRSVDDMVRNCIQSIINDNSGRENPYRIV